MRIYLAGKMRGLPNFQVEVFDREAAKLRAQGHDVFSPAEYTRNLYGPQVYENNLEGDESKAGMDGRTVFEADLTWICRNAEVIALLPGWETSLGATAERATGIALGLEIWEL